MGGVGLDLLLNPIFGRVPLLDRVNAWGVGMGRGVFNAGGGEGGTNRIPQAMFLIQEMMQRFHLNRQVNRGFLITVACSSVQEIYDEERQSCIYLITPLKLPDGLANLGDVTKFGCSKDFRSRLYKYRVGSIMHYMFSFNGINDVLREFGLREVVDLKAIESLALRHLKTAMGRDPIPGKREYFEVESSEDIKRMQFHLDDFFHGEEFYDYLWYNYFNGMN